MEISVFGLGYVGTVTAAALAAAGHRVRGVDVDRSKLALLRRGQSPVTEPGLDDLIGRAIRTGALTATEDAEDAVLASELSLVCVATPSRRNGSLDTSFLERVIAEIGSALRKKREYHVIAIRSTLLPGLLQARLVPLLESRTGRPVSEQVGICVSPEFLREGSAIRDFQNPPFTVVGETERRAGDVLLRAYAHLDAPIHRLTPEAAAMVKYASNAYHALKVTFANEIGALCGELGIDAQDVMRVFCEDTNLNISAKYLRPGFAFGGSCLPKDLRALLHETKTVDLTLPLMQSVLPSNDAHIQRTVDAVLELRKRRVALLGLSFKPGSDDLRESPLVRLAEALIGKGVQLRIFDPDVALAQVFGRNLAYIQETLPHVADLLCQDKDLLLSDAEIVILGKPMPEFDLLVARLRPDQTLINLLRPALPRSGVTAIA